MCETCCCSKRREPYRTEVSEKTRRRADSVIGTWTIVHLLAGVGAALSGAAAPALLLLGSGACAAGFLWLLPEPICWVESVASVTLVELALALAAWA